MNMGDVVTRTQCPLCRGWTLRDEKGNSESTHAPLCDKVQELERRLDSQGRLIDHLAEALVRAGLIEEFRP